MSKLNQHYKFPELEAGCDEAGRGCLAGPVFAAAVIFPKGTLIPEINDSKKLSEKMRNKLAEEIKKQALCYSIFQVENEKIDQINILRASVLAMQCAVKELSIKPKFLIIDGNRFEKFQNIPFETIIKGDSKYQSIAAASILAKTARDDYMIKIHEEFPYYKWNKNKGYPSLEHKLAIKQNGLSKYHRKSFNSSLTPKQLRLFD